MGEREGLPSGRLRLDQLGGLELLLAVASSGSVSAAARLHGIAQPSASTRLRRLEYTLGLTLLDRQPAGSGLTEEGMAVVEWSRSVMSAVGRLEAGVNSLRRQGPAPLRVAASFTIAEYLLPDWLRTARVRGGPAVELAVANSVDVANRIRNGQADVGFVESPRRFADLHSRTVGTDELVIVCAPRHRWARRRTAIGAEALAETPLIQREAGSGTREFTEMAFRRAGTQPVEPLLVLGSTTAVKAAVSAGDGPAVLSRLAVASELADGSLVTVKAVGMDLTRPLRAVWKGSAKPPPRTSALLAAATASWAHQVGGRPTSVGDHAGH